MGEDAFVKRLICLVVVTVASVVGAAEIHVSASGGADGDGTEGRPLASLARARDAIRAMKDAGRYPADGVTVIVREGIYPVTDTFTLGKQDSGRAGVPVTYRAAGAVRFIGGRKLGAFTAVTDKRVLSRLDESVRRKVVQVDLKAAGIVDYGRIAPAGFGGTKTLRHMELFYNATPMRLAEWPNGGWTTIASIPKGPMIYDDSDVKRGTKTDRIGYAGDRPKRWRSTDDVWIHGYWYYDWADSYMAVEAIDTDARTIRFGKNVSSYGYRKAQRFRFLNVLEELDAPGEYHIDRARGVLTFLPPGGAEGGEAVVSVLAGPFVRMKDVSHVRLVGLTFECGRSDGLQMQGGEGNEIAGCTFRNLGGGGVSVTGGKGHVVRSCDLYGLGGGGIGISSGDRKTLTQAGHAAINNHIHHYSRWVRTYNAAIAIRGVGNRMAHNEIHDAPHAAILASGNNHVVEFNDVHRTCLETGDVGGYYMGRDWTERGTVIRHNYFHHLGGLNMGSNAVYLDDMASGITVTGNVFHKVWRGIMVGGGRDNTIENNLFVDNKIGIHLDARGMTWARSRIEIRKGGWNIYGRLEAVAYNKPPYSTQYPKLATVLENEPLKPTGNVIVRNIHSGGKWLAVMKGMDLAWVKLEGNVTEGEAGFVDRAKGDFRLKADSPARETGFQPIPFEKIGLQRDEYRRGRK